MDANLNYKKIKFELIETLNSLKKPSALKQREEFKELDWFFKFNDEFPENWLDVNFMDVTWLITCGVAKKPIYVEAGIPFLSAQNARPFKANLDKIRFITESQYKTLTVGGKPERSDILYTRVGNCGEAAKITFDFDFAIYVSLTLIKPIHELINCDYLVAFLNSRYGLEQASTGAIGTGLQNLNVNNVRKYRIPLPPLPEQQRIVAKLDTLFGHLNALKTRLDRIPQLLKDFRQKVLTQAVTGKLTEEWREGRELKKTSLVEIKSNTVRFDSQLEYNIPTSWLFLKAESVTDKITDGEHQTPPRIPMGKMLLSAKNVRNGFIDYRDFDFISEEDYDSCLKRCKAEIGDVLIVSVGATIGRTATVTENRGFALVRSVGLLKPKSEIIGKFLMFVLQSHFLQKVIGDVSQGSAQPCLYINKINGLPIPVPSLEEQQKIVSRVESLFAKADLIEASYQKLKTKIEQLPQAMLAKAFRGELVAQLPTDGDASELLEQIKRAK